jgi:hypothetical protein
MLTEPQLPRVFSDVYIIEGVPPEFFHLNIYQFEEMLTKMPLGERLKCQASWPERIYVAEFLNLLKYRPNPLRTNSRKNLSDRELYVCLGILRWFGTNCGRCFVNDALKESDGKFFSLWDGKDFWRKGIHSMIKEYSLEQILDPDPPRFMQKHIRTLPYPKSSQQDRDTVTRLMRWLSQEGALFLRGVVDKIEQRVKDNNHAQHISFEKYLIDAKLYKQQQKLYAEAGIS